METLDPAIAKAPTPRHLTEEDSEAERGDENPPRAGTRRNRGRNQSQGPPPHKQNPAPRGKREPLPTRTRAKSAQACQRTA